MNSILRLACGLIFLSILFSPVAAQTKNNADISAGTLIAEHMQNEITVGSLPGNISGNWHQQAIEQLKQREYFIRPFSASNTFAAANRSQQLGFLFTPDGYEVKRFNFSDQYQTLWQSKFLLNGIGRSGHILLPAQNGQPAYAGRQLQYQYPGFEVQYHNTPQGMRQNFVINQKPQGKNFLEVVLQVKGDLQPVLYNDKSLVLYKQDNAQQPALAYDDLKAWDADYRPLPAHIELDKVSNTIKLVVDDQNAVYPITVDPLNHTPDWTDNGQGLVFPLLDDLSVPLLYGFSVSGAGDVNNDGFDDIIIGAPAYIDIISISGGTFNLVSVGAAFIYFGSSSGPSLTPSEALQPTGFAGALFGFSVSKAGDINNDGFDDVVIGAPADHIDLRVGLFIVSVAVGRVYVYHGTAFDGNINTSPVVSAIVNPQQVDFGVLLTTPINPLYGFSVGNAGDVNADGFADIVVGSPAYLNLIPLIRAGRIDVYHGSGSGLNTVPASKVRGGLLSGLFGYSVSTAGKVNNDSFDDIIVGAPISIGIVSVGCAYVFHGSASGITATAAIDANTTLESPGLLTQTLFGYSVSNAGDVNGDGLDDVIVGEPLSLEATLSLQLIAVGKAHIFYGSNTGVQTLGATQLTSPRQPSILGLLQGNLLYGFSVSTAGDVNCDGLADVIVGEPGGTAISLGTGVLGLVSANILSGKAYVYYGRATTGPANSPAWFLQETGDLSIANLLGASVSDAGDVNGDGNADLLVGAPNGTMNFASSIIGIIGGALDIITANGIGSAYSFFGCLTDEDLDFDNDGTPDALDMDDDNDGIADNAEYPGLSLSDDPGADADGDGIANYQDASFTGCGGLNSNGVCANLDKDGDGVPNSFELDSDNDGIPDVIEAGGVDTDGDGMLDGFTDTDGDGLSQSIDANNTGVAGSGNGLAAPDFDGDGIPNSLDLDSDGDGITDLREAGLPDADNNGRADGLIDADGDGFTDAIDPKNGHSGSGDLAGSGTPALFTPTDTDNDGRYNGIPIPGNQDAENSDDDYNFLDIDSDNDGITDNVEAQTTAAYLLPAIGDTDADGLADVYDSQGGVFAAGGIVPNNHDSTDNADYLDMDSDNDELGDIQDGHDRNRNAMLDDDIDLTLIDTDGDGLDDKFDLAEGPNVTTEGAGNPPVPGSFGPLQNTPGGPDNDWRNRDFQLTIRGRPSNDSVVIVVVPEEDKNKQITVYPNPVKDYMQLVWNNMEPGAYRVDIFQTAGQLVKSYRMVINGAHQVEAIRRENNWKPGIYLLRISSNNRQVFSIKVVIE